SGIGADLWVPMAMRDQLYPGPAWLTSRGQRWINGVIGRLKPGIRIEQASAAVNSLLMRLREEYPNTNKGLSADLYPDSESSLHPVVRGGFTAFLSLMFAVVAAILLLACANVAGLLLARSVARRREISLRMALGAGRGRLMRQLLSESLVLASLGGAAGLLLGYWLIRAVNALRPATDIPLHVEAGLDWNVLAFTAAATVATGFIFGLTPALAAVKHDLVSSLKQGGLLQTVATSRLRRLLVAGQIVLSCLLLVGALLLVRSLQQVRDLDLGFNPDNQLAAALDLQLNRYEESRGKQFLQDLKERLSSLPGVQAVGFAEVMPLSMHNQQAGVLPEGYQPPPEAGNPSIDHNVVDEDYFRAMGIPILQGRGFTKSDGPDAPPVMVVNQAFAQRFWAGQNAIGKRVRRGPDDYVVVGVVKTGKYFSLGEDPKAYMYQSMRQLYQGSLNVHIRTTGNPESLSNAVREVVRALDETLPVSNLQTMNDALGFALLPARLGAGAVSAFAFLALFLAAVGLYGMISYFVSQSSRDLAVRSAMGATPGDLIRLVLRQGAFTVLPGLALGLLIAGAATRLMAGLLYGISAGDPISFLAASSVLAVVSPGAAYLPARRAAGMDPITALREI
ncbi:MAG: FtsX-like permease family protein, partial [Acidobacteria bacterium]|nr:FtsX-like permease family protein [Acidobacteriota bacterium]